MYGSGLSLRFVQKQLRRAVERVAPQYAEWELKFLHGGDPVQVAVDQVLFLEPIHLGDLVTLTAELTYVGRTSMEVRIDVKAANLIGGREKHTNTAYFVYVALDGAGQPAPVPPLLLESEAEREQWAAARERQSYRLAQRDQGKR